MGKLWTAASFAGAVALSATLAAQSGQPGSSSSQYPSQDDKTVTVTGCVQQADSMGMPSAGSTGTSGSTGMSSKAGDKQFVLTNAKVSSERSGMGSTSGTSGSGTTGSGTSSSGSSELTGTTYKLDGKETELSEHVGQRVEIKGKLKSKDEMGSTGAGTSGATGSTGSQHSMANMTLKVDSVRRIEGTCPAAK
jgi:hypothetical protein